MARFVLLTTVAVACAALLIAPLARSNPILIWNASPSVPIGLYFVEGRSPRIGEIAVLRPPKWATTLADHRRYLPSSALLLKPVAAEEGDIVCRFGAHVFVNGGLQPKALREDRLKRPLPSWKGCLRLGTKQIFVLSKRKDSFDSRYFGVVEERQVLGTGKLVFSVQ
jgi:conjugative transfer signal peptidase TraF